LGLSPAVRALPLLLLLTLLTGCDNANVAGEGPETEHPDYRQGSALLQQGDNRRALNCFLNVIADRRESPEAHLEAGRLYLELKEPLPAIYHLKQSIRLKNRPERVASIAQLIRTAEKQFMQQIPGQPFDPEAGVISVDTSQRIAQLQAENSRLKRELEELLRQGRGAPAAGSTLINLGAAAPATPAAAPTAPLPAGARSYTTVAGDTLFGISRKAYGTPTRWQDIQRANADKLGSSTQVRPGMVLVIPQ
jgi:tetratricopeptide (TPR) repeat protein